MAEEKENQSFPPQHQKQEPGKRGDMSPVPCYLFLASDDSSFMTGQVPPPNGGEIVNG